MERGIAIRLASLTLVGGLVTFYLYPLVESSDGSSNAPIKYEIAREIEVALNIGYGEGKRNYLQEGDTYSAQIEGCLLTVVHRKNESRVCKGSVNPSGALEETYIIDLRVVDAVEVLSDTRGFSLIYFIENEKRKALVDFPYREYYRSCDRKFFGPFKESRQPSITFPLDSISSAGKLISRYVELQCDGEIGGNNDG